MDTNEIITTEEPIEEEVTATTTPEATDGGTDLTFLIGAAVGLGAASIGRFVWTKAIKPAVVKIKSKRKKKSDVVIDGEAKIIDEEVEEESKDSEKEPEKEKSKK